MYSDRGDWALPQPGFPIRISTDQSLVGSSPWLFAATHVLHRHLAPRHPPLALHSLRFQRCSCSLCSSQGTAYARRRQEALPTVVVAPEQSSTATREVTRTSRRDARTRRPNRPARGTLPHNRAVKPDSVSRSVVPGR